ncbi:lactoylglutathione lyase [Micrococcus porci]|uniref:VOC family protein n=1 Tax=Micrococcus porci TaxID=2856555 RepID=UPI001CCF14A6|nr:VOC family protein [Micrococcus porci]UBH25138.1 lactoylglutathione lyase [Micrococcus porci]
MALFSQPVYINLPSTDTERIREFWTSMGADIDEDFSDENSVCVQLTESTFAMYLSPGFYTDFIGDREIADCLTTNSVLLQLTAPDRGAVDALVRAAVEAGGSEVPLPDELQEDMTATGVHSRQVVDPDGHQWEFMAA